LIFSVVQLKVFHLLIRIKLFKLHVFVKIQWVILKIIGLYLCWMVLLQYQVLMLSICILKNRCFKILKSCLYLMILTSLLDIIWWILIWNFSYKEQKYWRWKTMDILEEIYLDYLLLKQGDFNLKQWEWDKLLK